ncbi:MAG: hypothetical protein NUV80_06780 [Candidatus Berkelbacteria bacterium]|nr:hypothetical protein [Candidatus Berkelbacteria bacterium]
MSVIDSLNFIEGLYSDVPPHLVPATGLYLMDNVVTTQKMGAIQKRCGYQNLGTALQAGKSITGLHNFRQSTSVQKMLATVDDSTSDDTQLFYSTGTTWTEVAAAETAWANKAGINVEMEDFIGYCFFVGWGATDGFLPVGSLTGTTFSTSTNVTSMPSAKYIKRYRDRLYIGNCDISATAYPYRVYFSSVPAAGSITWTVATDFVDVDYSESVTGLGENWDRLVIFTEYSAYMYNQTEFKKVWDRGCSNHRTIKNSGGYMIWADMDGVWISTGGRPENVSGRIKDFIQFSNMTNAFAEVVDEEYHLHIGSVTVNGISYSNCALVLNIPSMTWRVHEYADTMTMFSKFYASGNDHLWMGDSSGDVHELGKYTDSTLLTSDDGNDITSWFQTGGITLDNISIVKRMNKIIAYADRAQGLNLKARIIDNNTIALTEFKKLGQLKKYINEYHISPNVGNILQIEGTEVGQLPYWSLFGFSIDYTADKPFKI